MKFFPPRFVLLILATLFWPQPSIAEMEVTSSGRDGKSTWRTVGDLSVHEEKLAKLPKNPRKLTDAEIPLLRVEWVGSEHGYLGLGGITEPRTPRWKSAAKGERHREVAVRGRLALISPDGKPPVPVNWPLPVRVLMERKPGSAPDWTSGHTVKTTASDDCLVEKDGTFLVTFRIGSMERVPGQRTKFRTALCLGQQEGKLITWKNTFPVLPATIGEVEIAGPPELTPTQQLICACPSLRAEGFDAAALVRAVNALHKLGKDQALSEMKTFLSLAGQNHVRDRNPRDIDTADAECVFLIVRLLFVPVDPVGRIPVPRLGSPSPGIPEGDEIKWPLYPLALVDETPLILHVGYRLGGIGENPLNHIDWAEKHGKLREQPLRPGDNPLLTSEKLLATPEGQRMFGKAFADYYYGVVLRVAVQAVAPLLKPADDYFPFHARRGYDAAADWASCKEQAEKLALRWDADEMKWKPGAGVK